MVKETRALVGEEVGDVGGGTGRSWSSHQFTNPMFIELNEKFQKTGEKIFTD